MKYTKIANRKVSAMSLGTVQLGLDYGIANVEGKPGREKGFAIIKAALDNGVTAFDTARSYGEAEDVLGAFFSASPGMADKAFITTKLKSGLPEGSPGADVEKALYRSAETSLKSLGIKKVHCLMLHDAADIMIHGPAARKSLEGMIKKGYADTAGVSVYHPGEAETMLSDDIWQIVQIPVNLFDLRFITQGTVEKLKNHGVHIFVRSVFFQGIFFLNPDEVTEPDLLRLAVPHIRTLRKLSEDAGISIGQLAIAYVRDIPGITSLVLGSENPRQVAENAALFETGPLKESLRQKIEKEFSGIDYPGIMEVLSRTYGRSGQYKKQ
jgi:aryl-alcohol dehydrogenase-like predicted oxidoreductase